MTTLTINPNATTQELANQALDFAKYGNDAEAMEFLNEILSELRWSMRDCEFKDFHIRILKLVEESSK